MNNVMVQPLLYFDLLGFSEFVEDSSITDVLEFYTQLLKNNDSFDPADLGLSHLILSDSIFIWSDCKDLDTNLKIIGYLACVNLHNSSTFNGVPRFGHNRPIRGSLVLEEFIIEQRTLNLGFKTSLDGLTEPWLINNLTILGKGIVQAAKWETRQNWLGISVVPKNLEKMKALAPEGFRFLVENFYLVEWKVPTKEGFERTFAVNPLAAILRHGKILNESLIKSEHLASDKNKAKFSNTLLFLNHIIDRNMGIDSSNIFKDMKLEYKSKNSSKSKALEQVKLK